MRDCFVRLIGAFVVSMLLGGVLVHAVGTFPVAASEGETFPVNDPCEFCLQVFPWWLCWGCTD